MKAYHVRNEQDDEGRGTIVYAATEKQARASVANTDEVGNYGYVELKATRAPLFDGVPAGELSRAKYEAGWWSDCPRCHARVTDDAAPQAVIRGDTWFCSSRCSLDWLRRQRATSGHEQIALDRAALRYPGEQRVPHGVHPAGGVHVIVGNVWKTLMSDAACVLIERHGLVLAVSRKHDRHDWGLPGGKLEPDEDPLAAAVRELAEETGLTVEPHRLELVYSGVTHTKKWTPTYALTPKFLRRYSSELGQAMERRLAAPRDTGQGAVGWVSWEELCSPRATYHLYNRELRRAVHGAAAG
jgi:8-oxo-dGTP pyrophosphatase MutT (NUDIX family)